MNSAATPVAIHPSAPGPAAVTPRRLHFGPLELASRYLLSPLAGYTNYPFRLAVRALGGVGLATTDLVNARALLLASRKTMELIRTGTTCFIEAGTTKHTPEIVEAIGRTGIRGCIGKWSWDIPRQPANLINLMEALRRSVEAENPSGRPASRERAAARRAPGKRGHSRRKAG